MHDRYKLLPCDWLTGVYLPAHDRKAKFHKGYSYLVNTHDTHDDMVVRHAINQMLLRGSRTHQLPLFSQKTLSSLHDAKANHQLIKHFVCSCGNPESCCCVELPEHVSSAISDHQTDGDIHMLVDYLNAVENQ